MRRPSPSAVIALVALFVAAGGPAQAARLIDGGDIRKGTVGSKQVKDGALKREDLAARTVRSLRTTPRRSVVDAMLADAAVTTRALAPGSVLTGTVGDNSLTGADGGETATAAMLAAAGLLGALVVGRRRMRRVSLMPANGGH